VRRYASAAYAVEGAMRRAVNIQLSINSFDCAELSYTRVTYLLTRRGRMYQRVRVCLFLSVHV